jgi:hypothetical protein
MDTRFKTRAWPSGNESSRIDCYRRCTDYANNGSDPSGT